MIYIYIYIYIYYILYIYIYILYINLHLSVHLENCHCIIRYTEVHSQNIFLLLFILLNYKYIIFKFIYIYSDMLDYKYVLLFY